MINQKIFSKEIFNLPNLISLIRIFIIIPCSISLINEDYFMTVVYFAFSGISDVLDGILARRLNQITKLGQILDPVADKLTLAAVAICLSFKIPDIIPVAIVFIIKDFMMIIAGVDLLNKHISPPPAKWYGKIATFFFYLSISTVLCMKIFEINIPILTWSLFFITTLMMIYALIKYFMVYRKLIMNK